jgi:hypothetical protein
MVSDDQAPGSSSAVTTIRSVSLTRLKPIVGRMTLGCGVLAVETHDVWNCGVLQPLGLEVCQALRRRHGIQLVENIAVVPAEAAALRTQATDRLAITRRNLLVAARDRSTSTP